MFRPLRHSLCRAPEPYAHYDANGLAGPSAAQGLPGGGVSVILALPFSTVATAQEAIVEIAQPDCNCDMRMRTAHYTVTITDHCPPQSEYTCRRYVYTSTSSSGKTLVLTGGRQMYRVCPYDNLTPCAFTGYYFPYRGDRYYVNYPLGGLEVMRGRKTLLKEDAISIEP